MIVWTITRVTESFVPVSAVSFTIRVGTPGVGVPPGGATGTVLRKASATDYDTEWGGITSSSITDSTATGRAVLTAASAAAARSAISAGDALTSGTLAQFAATTSAQLAGVLTDETGSGAAVFGTSPTITTPIVSGTLTVRQAAGAATVTVSHDGSNARVQPSAGQVRFHDSGGTSRIAIDPNEANGGRFDVRQIWVTSQPSLAPRLQVSWDGNFSRAVTGFVYGWGSSATDATATAMSVAFGRNADGVVEINNGTAGALRDLTLRNLTASGTVTASTVNSAGNLVLSAAAGPSFTVRTDNTFDIGANGTHTCGQRLAIGSGGLNLVSGAAITVASSATQYFTGIDTSLSRHSAGVWQCGTGANNALGSLRLTNLIATGLTTLGTYTVGTLPSASANAGALAQVTDSSVTTNGSNVAGGGANRVAVFSNGTNWKVVVA